MADPNTIFKDKRILVTGGTGSMGKTLIRRILSGKHGNPQKVIIFSRDEAKQHDLRMEFQHRLVATDEVIYRNFSQTLEFRIGDVRDYADVCASVKDANIVINAAALKQVPTCEYFPLQAVLTNCIGPSNIIRAIQENGYPVDTVVGISTDKAAKPVNVMGMTKSVQERIFIAANVLVPNTRFVNVRYGNVLASRGSAIPLFYNQIAMGGPITITVPEMTRFLLSLEQAVDTVVACIAEAAAGEIYVPNAPSATVINIAKALIGNRKVEIKIIGIRPGEKMHEIMISEEEMYYASPRGDYFAIHPMLPELNKGGIKGTGLVRELNSAINVLAFEETVELLKKHNLLEPPAKGGGEILR